MTQSNSGRDATLIPHHPSEAAYQQLFPELVALDPAELVPITVEVLTAVTTVLGALPEIRALRPQIEAEWRSFDFERFDKLEVYALALSHAHALWRGASVRKTAVTALAEELAAIREQLLLDARALAGRSLIEGERLQNCKLVPGYRAIASDVLTIVVVLKEGWQVLQGKTPLTLEELNDAASKATDLLAAIGLKEQAPTTVGEASLLRQKAFTLFANTYDDARRAVLYLRAKEEDGDDIAPSIYGGRARRGSVESAEGVGTAASGAVDGPAGPQSDSDAPIPFSNPLNLPITSPFVS
jgi:hypothetical protein